MAEVVDSAWIQARGGVRWAKEFGHTLRLDMLEDRLAVDRAARVDALEVADRLRGVRTSLGWSWSGHTADLADTRFGAAVTLAERIFEALETRIAALEAVVAAARTYKARIEQVEDEWQPPPATWSPMLPPFAPYGQWARAQNAEVWALAAVHLSALVAVLIAQSRVLGQGGFGPGASPPDPGPGDPLSGVGGWLWMPGEPARPHPQSASAGSESGVFGENGFGETRPRGGDGGPQRWTGPAVGGDESLLLWGPPRES